MRKGVVIILFSLIFPLYLYASGSMDCDSLARSEDYIGELTKLVDSVKQRLSIVAPVYLSRSTLPNIIIKKSNNKEEYARLCNANTIFITDFALRLCSDIFGDAAEHCVAFILSHELGHLSHGFLHQQLGYMISDDIVKELYKKDNKAITDIKNEMVADGRAIFLSVAAGYNPARIWSNSEFQRRFKKYNEADKTDDKRRLAYILKMFDNYTLVAHMYKIIKVLLLSEKFNEAERLIDYVINITNDNFYPPEIDVYRGILYLSKYKEGKTLNCTLIYPHSTVLDPIITLRDELRSRSRRGDDSSTELLLKESINSFNKANSRDPDNPIVLNDLACAEFAAEDVNLAKAHLEKAKKIKSPFKDIIDSNLQKTKKANVKESMNKIVYLSDDIPTNNEGYECNSISKPEHAILLEICSRKDNTSHYYKFISEKNSDNELKIYIVQSGLNTEECKNNNCPLLKKYYYTGKSGEYDIYRSISNDQILLLRDNKIIESYVIKGGAL